MQTDRHPKQAAWELPAAIWQRMALLIPPKQGTEGHPRTVDLRRIPEGIFSVLRTGMQWPACPRDHFGPPSTVYYYCAHWVQAGMFAQLWQEALAVYDDLQGLEWTWQSLDGAMPTAPLAARPRAPIPRTVASGGPSGVC